VHIVGHSDCVNSEFLLNSTHVCAVAYCNSLV